jgi:hypothetical protein
MTTCAQSERCAVCATTGGPFEAHHIALRTNHSATVMLCPGCHRDQTERQLQAGLIGRGNAPSDDPAVALLHALSEGLAGIFIAHARRTGNFDLAKLGQQFRRTTLRLLPTVSNERPGAFGPRPISNDRHRRAGKPQQARGMLAPGPSPSVTESLHALAGILPAFAAAATDPLPDTAELLPGVTVDELCGLLSPSGARRIACNLATLEEHPCAGELAAIIERDWDAALSAVTQLAAGDPAADDGNPPEQLIESLREFYTLTERWTACLLALAADGDPAQVFERFLDRGASEPDRRPRLTA